MNCFPAGVPIFVCEIFTFGLCGYILKHMNEKIPDMNENVPDVGEETPSMLKRVLGYAESMKLALARAIHYVTARRLENNGPDMVSEDSNEEINLGRRGVLKSGGGLLFAAGTIGVQPEIISANVIKGLGKISLGQNELKIIAKLAVANDWSKGSLQDVLLAMIDSPEASKQTAANLTKIIRSGVGKQEISAFIDSNPLIREMTTMMFSDRMPDMPLQDLGKPGVRKALAELGVNIPESVFGKLSALSDKFDTLHDVQSQVRCDFMPTVEAYVKNVMSQKNVLDTEVVRDIESMQEIFNRWDFKQFFEAHSEYAHVKDAVDRACHYIKVLDAINSGKDPNPEDLKRLGKDSVEIGENAIITNNYPSARDLASRNLGKLIMLIPLGSKEAQPVSVEARKYKEFAELFNKAKRESPVGFVKVIVAN